MTVSPADFVRYFELGFGLVYIPLGTKGPRTDGWQDHPITNEADAIRIWKNSGGIGLHHARSRTAVLDIDHPEWAARALAAVGISLDNLLNAPGPKIRGAKGVKPVYCLPNGLELGRKALAWTEPGAAKAVTVFELRAGKTQDLLPPSIHPDTHKPYTWEPASPERREDFPELPGELRALWKHWGQLQPVLNKAQPWAAPPPLRTYGEGHSVIGAFNARYNVRDVLAQNSYEQIGPDRFLSPYSSTGAPGIVILKGDDGLERIFCHHASDPLYSDGHSYDAFSIFAVLEHGSDIKAAVKAAAADLGMSHTGTPPKPRPMLTRMSDVEPQEVKWLWPPYIPLGKLTLLEGDPGLGKTFISLALAAAVSRGWPLLLQTGAPGDEFEPSNVLYMTAEDGLADTLRPRLDAANADVSRVYTLDGWELMNEREETITGAVNLGDVAILDQALEKVKPKLVIVDPLQAYLGAGVDMHRANEVRPVLSALGNLAEEHECAVICIRHLSKAMSPKAIYSGMGSIDFAAAARSILSVGEYEGERLLAHVKSSLAPQGKSIRYELRDGSLNWLGVSDVTAEDIRVPQRVESESTVDAAVAFLVSFFTDGPQPANATFKAAKIEGISERTLKRAKAQLGIESRRVSAGNAGEGEWRWSLPDIG